MDDKERIEKLVLKEIEAKKNLRSIEYLFQVEKMTPLIAKEMNIDENTVREVLNSTIGILEDMVKYDKEAVTELLKKRFGIKLEDDDT
ncbi:MAG: hypothetical protein WC984_01105 [Bacteroidales bacterium]|jgi:hypothetical protein